MVTLQCPDGSELMNYQTAVIAACSCETCSHSPGVISLPGSGGFKPTEIPTTELGSGSGEGEEENDVFDFIKAFQKK